MATVPDSVNHPMPRDARAADYRAIFDAANDAIFVHDLDSGAILDVNQRMCDLYGYTVAEATKLSVGDLSANESPYTNEDAKRWIQAAAAGEPQLFEWLARDKGGKIFWVEVNLKRTCMGSVDVMLAVVRDITIRKRVMDQLRQSQDRFAKAFSANPQPMSLTTLPEGRYIDVNEGFLTLSGYTREEVIGRSALDLNIWENPERRAEFLEQFSCSGSIKNVETKFRTKSGSIRVLLTSAEQIEVAGEKCLLVAASDITERKQAEDALRESQDRLRLAYQAALMGSFEWNVETGINIWTPELEALYGLEPGSFSGTQRGWEDLVHPEDRQKAVGSVQRAFETGASSDGKWRVIWPDGTTHWIYGRFQVFPNAAGEPARLAGINIDITERQLAQEALLESEARFRNLADTAPVLIWISGPDKLCTYFNQQWLEFTGRTIDQEVGNGWAEGVYPDDYERCIQTYVTAFDSRVPFEMEYRLRRADGIYRWVYDIGRPRFMHTGEFLGYIGSCTDITDHKLAEETARAAMNELQIIADSLPVLVAHIDANCVYRFNNLTYEEWFGKPRSEITGHHMRDVLGQELWQKLRPMIEQALAGKEVRYEHVVSDRGNQARHVSVTQTPVRDADGRVRGVVSLVSDITETRRAEQSLRDLSVKLIQAQEEERSRVARELHDDLSQKMALLAIELEYVGKHPAMPDAELKTRMSDLFEDAREISSEIHRISHQLHPSKLDRLGLAKAVKSFVAEFGANHEIEIQVSTKGFPARLPQDVSLCAFRIVQESLRNVFKHSGAKQADISLELADGLLKVTITDNGCGFETKSQSMSRGLGFISMRERLRSVAGSLSISSQPDTGTQVQASIPLQSVAIRIEERQPEPSTPNPIARRHDNQEGR